MKHRSVRGVFVFGLLVVLAACGNSGSTSNGSSNSGSTSTGGSSSSSGSSSGSASGGPADVAKGFFTALYSSGQIGSFECATNKAAVDGYAQYIANSKAGLTNATFDVSDLTFTRSEEHTS